MSTLSVDISALWAKKGLITKDIDPQNQRVKLVKLTQKGRDKLKTIMKKKGQIFKAIVDSMDLTPEEHEFLVNLLKERALPGMDKNIEALKNQK